MEQATIVKESMEEIAQIVGARSFPLGPRPSDANTDSDLIQRGVPAYDVAKRDCFNRGARRA